MWMYAGLLAAFSTATAQDSSAYKIRKLTFEEANIVSSYYQQDGDHASVTGGKGSEKLTDFANIFDIKFFRNDRKDRKHEFTFQTGIDNYTSASSDQVDLQANSSASSSDMRIYPSLSWLAENKKSGNSIGAGLSYSTEFDYKSFGADFSIGKKTRNRNGELMLKLQAFLDNVKLIYPVELRHEGADNIDYSNPSSPRNSYSAAGSYSQIINQRLQVLFSAEVISQKGYLGLPFHRVYLNDNSVHVEKLPDTRLKVPLGVRASYFLGDKIILRAFYRYYQDSWDLRSNTASIEIPIKLNPFLSFTPFYRYYDQTAVKYFAGINMHDPSDEFYTSNYDLSKFISNFFGAGFRYMPLKGIFGIQHLAMAEMRYGFYQRSNGLQSSIVSLQLKFQ
jgi:hypothetical protein